MTESPCCPSVVDWWGRAAIPRSWALQTWIEMAKCGIGTNTMLNGSAMPLEHDKHVLKCCPTGDEQAVFKWSTRAGVRWLSQLCNEAGTHPTQETLSRMLANTSVLHATADTETARALTTILGGKLQTDPKTQGGKLREPLGSWNTLVHHRGYEGSFVELSEPGKPPRLIEVCSPQEPPRWQCMPAPRVGVHTNWELK